jgi:hypothetical protein
MATSVCHYWTRHRLAYRANRGSIARLIYRILMIFPGLLEISDESRVMFFYGRRNQVPMVLFEVVIRIGGSHNL